ncbi:phosphopantothenoylcysteine decarboxylase [Streptococcus intermedius]|jgi:phosphopantothenoylcysteine decarboxylase|uniref:Phosphopantothenoylcysteine decarboxylase n=1 Tax=Streptococcus intermedius TaxID=1338 RepID=A0AAD1C8P8_STRIT|nr:phosphopantothenoylcysteine decarboxylase [Streptococcus intermedius]PMR66315.1 phosphopantothenoylcysteine decarboxylase [Streptococcus intermedius]BAW17238.1 phosphopantothenoylcysteine decarboxylase [Streptococcus intermedius]
MKHITLAVTGSIAAYKAADLTSQFTKNNLDVTVLMSSAATNFIPPLTLQVLSKHIVHTDVMDEPAPNKVNHIEIAKQTDLFLVAPATANTIAKLANGFADNMITSTALALPTTVKKALAPAMNTKMYENPITQDNLSKLEKYGWYIIQPRETILACGDKGIGALASVETIMEKVKEIIYEETI